MATTARTASLIFPSLRLGTAKFSWQCGPSASIHSITRFARATSMGQRLKTSHASAVRRGAGAVVASKSDAFNVGNRVFVRGPGFGIMTDGTWREFVAAPAASLSLLPDGFDDDQAAAYLAGAGYLTGYLALTELAKFRPGQTVLAPGIGGAVGMETVQVARRLGASLAISTASSTRKANQARAAG